MARDLLARSRFTIALVAAVAGALVGSATTYVANRALDHEQSASAVRGAARVLQRQLADVDFRLSAMLESGHPVPRMSIATVSIAADDERLIASQLAGEDWNDVALAIDVVDRLREIEGDVPDWFYESDTTLSEAQRDFYANIDAIVRRAVEALDDLTQPR